MHNIQVDVGIREILMPPLHPRRFRCEVSLWQNKRANGGIPQYLSDDSKITVIPIPHRSNQFLLQPEFRPPLSRGMVRVIELLPYHLTMM